MLITFLLQNALLFNKDWLYLQYNLKQTIMATTAVEWLVEQLDGEKHLTDNEIKRVIEQAKEMEMSQIIDAFDDGAYHNKFGNENYESAEDYFDKIFNK